MLGHIVQNKNLQRQTKAPASVDFQPGPLQPRPQHLQGFPIPLRSACNCSKLSSIARKGQPSAAPKRRISWQCEFALITPICGDHHEPRMRIHCCFLQLPGRGAITKLIMKVGAILCQGPQLHRHVQRLIVQLLLQGMANGTHSKPWTESFANRTVALRATSFQASCFPAA